MIEEEEIGRMEDSWSPDFRDDGLFLPPFMERTGIPVLTRDCFDLIETFELLPFPFL